MPSLRAIVLTALVALPATAGAQTASEPQRAVRARTLYEDLQMFSGVLNQIRVNHPDSVDAHALVMAAIRGMIEAQDPHSYVVQAVRFDPEREKLFRENKLHPVPVNFEDYGGAFVVVSVEPGTAAARLDILPGDELVEVDGKPLTAESAFELEVQLAGPKNSTASLVFERRRSDGTYVTLTRAVKRERPEESTAVPAAFMLDAQTGYVRITTFASARVADDLHDALGRLEKQGMTRLVLDVRGNGGGSVDEAASVAGEFLPKGAVVYMSQTKKKSDLPDTARVSRSFFSREKRYPIVLLINQGSASASELLAGALQDHDRALIVGRTSFGKSLVMTPFYLPDGSYYNMVIGLLKTPCGRVVQRQYRGRRLRDYYRLAGKERDVAGRPSCRTSGGRTVYGGGGIYPDVVLDARQPTPVWLARVYEEALPLKWIGGHLSANAGAYSSLDALASNPTLPPAVLADFRQFAASQQVTVPEGADADRHLTVALLEQIAYAKWNEAGLYRIAAVLDAEVKAGVAAFGKAAEILKGP
jgi:carboxyl-terminal processing protease